MLYIAIHPNNYDSCPSVRLSIMEGQQKRFDPMTQEAVSLAIEHWKAELDNQCKWQS